MAFISHEWFRMAATIVMAISLLSAVGFVVRVYFSKQIDKEEG